jgi:hypothetical protein
MNRKVEEMSKGENIVKGQRISWIGHLERMEKDGIPRTASVV